MLGSYRGWMFRQSGLGLHWPPSLGIEGSALDGQTPNIIKYPT